MLGLDLAQLLLGAQIDGAETLAVALELVEVGFDLGDVGQWRIRLEAGEPGERLRLGLQDLADFGGEVGEAALHRLVTLLGARRSFPRRGERVMGGAGGTIGLGERVLARGERLGGGAARAFGGFDLGDQRASLRLELGRRVDERSVLGPGFFEPRLDGRDLRRGAFPPLGPGLRLGGDRGKAPLGNLDLAGERLRFGAHLGEPNAIGGDGRAGIGELGLDRDRGCEVFERERCGGARFLRFRERGGDPRLRLGQRRAARGDAVELALGGGMAVACGVGLALGRAPAPAGVVLGLPRRRHFAFGRGYRLPPRVEIGARRCAAPPRCRRGGCGRRAAVRPRSAHWRRRQSRPSATNRPPARPAAGRA